jgi:hypothetical protein
MTLNIVGSNSAINYLAFSVLVVTEIAPNAEIATFTTTLTAYTGSSSLVVSTELQHVTQADNIFRDWILIILHHWTTVFDNSQTASLTFTEENTLQFNFLTSNPS